MSNHAETRGKQRGIRKTSVLTLIDWADFEVPVGGGCVAIKLAYLAPAVLEKLLLHRCPLAVSIKDLTAIADLPWAEQVVAAFCSLEGSGIPQLLHPH